MGLIIIIIIVIVITNIISIIIDTFIYSSIHMCCKPKGVDGTGVIRFLAVWGYSRYLCGFTPTSHPNPFPPFYSVYL